VRGGARQYVRKIVAGVDEARLATPVRAITRDAQGVQVRTDAGTQHFDRLVLATHSDQALALLSDASPLERELLGAIRYQPNRAVLHTDTSVLPQRRKAWAAWTHKGYSARAGEGGIRPVLVALLRHEGDVACPVGPNLRRARRDGLAQTGDGRQRAVVDSDRLGGVARPVNRLRHDEGHGLADMAHRAIGQHRVGRGLNRRVVDGLDQALAGEIAQMPDLGMGQHQLHALHRPRRLKIGEAERGMGVRAAQNERMQALLRQEIGCIAPRSGYETLVLKTMHGLAHAELHWSHIARILNLSPKIGIGQQSGRLGKGAVRSAAMCPRQGSISPARPARPTSANP
jgi:hypothetical protein